MRNATLCLLVPLGDSGIGGGLPGWGGGWGSGPRPDQGLPGDQPYPDQGLPGSSGGRPSHPIYHPGHPDHGLPAHPDQGLPGGSGGRPSHPIHIPGVPDQGLPPGQPVTINPPPPPPAGHENELVIAVWRNGAWTITAYNTDVSAGHPLPGQPGVPTHPIAPTPAPKK